jgi:antitoxin Phd
MKIDVENLAPISETNKNFSKAARLVDRKGSIIILKNNALGYVPLGCSLLPQNKIAGDMAAGQVASRILVKHINVFTELGQWLPWTANRLGAFKKCLRPRAACRESAAGA